MNQVEPNLQSVGSETVSKVDVRESLAGTVDSPWLLVLGFLPSFRSSSADYTNLERCPLLCRTGPKKLPVFSIPSSNAGKVGMREKRLFGGSCNQEYFGRSCTSEAPKPDFLCSFIDVSREPWWNYVLARPTCRVVRQRATRAARASKRLNISRELHIVAYTASPISFNVKFLPLLIDTSAAN